MDVRFVWLVLALIAFVSTLSVTEAVRVAALHLRAVDHPGGRRLHRSPTARLGGLGIFWGFGVALAAATYGEGVWHLPIHPQGMGLVGLLAGCGVLLITGLLDDVRGMRATAKLALQVGAALCLYHFGWRVERLGIPGIGSWEVGPLSLALTVGWVVCVTNALNLIDGLDGLAGGLALVATLAASWLLAGSGTSSFLATGALAGALAGFLWFNLNPALIFMGDTGSLFVGFVLAALTMRAGQLVSAEAFPLVPVLLLAVPLADTTDAIRRRTLAAAATARSPLHFLREAKRRILAPDGMHVHHRLLRRGFSTRRAVALLWGTGASFAVAAALVLRAPVPGLALTAALAALAWAGLAALEPRAATAPLAPPAVQGPRVLALSALPATEVGEPAEVTSQAA